jgi:hypothetical protein
MFPQGVNMSSYGMIDEQHQKYGENAERDVHEIVMTAHDQPKDHHENGLNDRVS